jgi:hypothetical protein
MSTTGTTNFSLSFTDVAEEAFERSGAEMRTGYDLRTARRSMNLLTLEWANRGFNLWTVEQGAQALAMGVGSFTLPADTVDIMEAVLRQNDGNASTQMDIALGRIGVSVYATLPNKLLTGRPNQFYVDRQRDAPVFTVWPIPATNEYTIVYWRLRRIQDAGNGIETPDMPFRFLPALVSGLAYYIAMKIPEGANRLEGLQAEYEKQFGLAMQEDRQRVSHRAIPRIGHVGK